MELSLRDARKLFLQQQGLLRNNQFGRGKNAIAKSIKQLSYLQIDTISVVMRAHQHILQTRVSNFDQKQLDRLMAEREIYEYWAHAAAFMPMSHFRFSLPIMKGWRNSRKTDKKMAKEVLARIQSEGPLQSKDFEAPPNTKSNGWWDWKPAKKALEHLFLSGDLMVSGRSGFQKVYDLPERVLPESIDVSEPSIDELARHLVMTMADALGPATEIDLGYAKGTIFHMSRVSMGKPIKQAIQDLVDSGDLIEVLVGGAKHFCRPELLEALPLRTNRQVAKVLSPFDNLVINRRRAQHLFNFDYQLECYVPEAKRRYGYFVLPILLGDEVIGRMDCKAERKQQNLAIHNLVLEDDTAIDEATCTALSEGIRQFAEANECNTVRLGKCTSGLKNKLTL